MSPSIAQAKVSLDAVAAAAVGAIESELITALRVEAPTLSEPGRDPSGGLQPRCAFQQGHGINSKHRRRLPAPVPPEIGADIGLPHLSIRAENGPLAAQPDASGRARGRAQCDIAQAVVVAIERYVLPEDLCLRLENEA